MFHGIKIMSKYFSIITILLWLSISCSSPAGKKKRLTGTNSYANGFRIEKFENYTKLTVLNPWEKADNVAFEYFLFSEKSAIPGSAAGRNIIRTPVRRVICLSTTHLAYLDALEEAGSVAGVSGGRYINNTEIRERYEAGNICDVGYGQNLNYELLVSQKPDLVMAYGIGSEITAYVHKLKELGIPVLIVAEYLEESPLGKAEWVKFIGYLFEKEDIADDIFRQVESEYIKLKELTQGIARKPKVLVGSAYNGSWWVPGGNSYMANVIADAGGDYLGRDNSSRESYVISFENALVWGNEADIWINMGNMSSKSEIVASDERLASLNVFQKGRVFNNINRLSPHGGNDFWESGTINPHKVLSDLIMIFHPELLNGEMTYYREIK
jgi:iron complex transport system substrate-binding protein